ncbi:MAG: urea ABC transporter permease subunit UrtC [Spirochaetales bacterium]|jgi:urea transport system permease protein|nr:urea ABC transporter permease subunit UrtC [Spirochaetales bacterium]
MSEKNFLRKFPAWLTWGAPLVILAVMPFVLEPFRLGILGKFLAYAIAAVALNLLWGYTGILSLGHGVFFALGGYVLAFYLKLQSGELPDFMSWSGLQEIPWFIDLFRHGWFALPMVVILPGLFAFIIGLPTFHSSIKGVYFTILSQALALAMSILFVGLQPYTGGTNGITNFRGFFGISNRTPFMIIIMYAATLVCLVLVVLFTWRLLRTRIGKILVAIRDGENRLRFLGYNPTDYKLAVYTLSGSLAGLAGALFAPQAGIISPSSMGILPSVEIAVWVAVGGRGTLLGPVVGAIIVNFAKTFLSEGFPNYWLYFLGALFIGSILFFPDGVVGLWKKYRARRRTPAAVKEGL